MVSPPVPNSAEVFEGLGDLRQLGKSMVLPEEAQVQVRDHGIPAVSHDVDDVLPIRWKRMALDEADMVQSRRQPGMIRGNPISLVDADLRPALQEREVGAGHR